MREIRSRIRVKRYYIVFEITQIYAVHEFSRIENATADNNMLIGSYGSFFRIVGHELRSR